MSQVKIKKKKKKKKFKSIAVPRNVWLEIGTVHAWKTDLPALKRNSASLQPPLYYWMGPFPLGCWQWTHVLISLVAWHLAMSSMSKPTPLKHILLKTPTEHNHPQKMTNMFQRIVWEMRLFSNSQGKYFCATE